MRHLPAVSVITVEIESPTLHCLLALDDRPDALPELSCSLAVCFHRPPAFFQNNSHARLFYCRIADGNQPGFLVKSAVPFAKTQSNGMPRDTFTITVPAILSCHDCLPRSQPAQKNPSPSTSAEKMPAAARTSATPTSTGRPSTRTNLIPTTIPPTVVPFHAHIAT